MSEAVSNWLARIADWPLALGLMLAGIFLLAYFSRDNNVRRAPVQGDFGPLDAETLKLLKDLEHKAREFDAFVAEKIFEDGREGHVASDEHWTAEGTESVTPIPLRGPRLRLIKNSDLSN